MKLMNLNEKSRLIFLFFFFPSRIDFRPVKLLFCFFYFTLLHNLAFQKYCRMMTAKPEFKGIKMGYSISSLPCKTCS